MDNQKFTKVLKTFITSGNRLIDRLFKLEVVNENNKPVLKVTTTDNQDGLHVLQLQVDFVIRASDELNTLINSKIDDADTRTELKQALSVAISILSEDIKSKLKLLGGKELC